VERVDQVRENKGEKKENRRENKENVDW